jgi:hypothetical protein
VCKGAVCLSLLRVEWVLVRCGELCNGIFIFQSDGVNVLFVVQGVLLSVVQ